MHSLNGISILVAGTFIRNVNRRTGVKFCDRSSTAFKRRFLGQNLQIHPTSFRWWEPIVEWTLSNGDWLTSASSLFNNSFYYRTSTLNEQRLAGRATYLISRISRQILSPGKSSDLPSTTNFSLSRTSRRFCSSWFIRVVSGFSKKSR